MNGKSQSFCSNLPCQVHLFATSLSFLLADSYQLMNIITLLQFQSIYGGF